MTPTRPPVNIDPTRCDHARGCPVARVCPVQAVEDAGSHWRVDEGRCKRCALCAQYCPQGAVTVG
jgi:carbon-monoxide dehydrogenase iron sulfur subunit